MNPQVELPGERKNAVKSYIQSTIFFLYKSFKTFRFDISFLKAENYFGDFSGGPTVKDCLPMVEELRSHVPRGQKAVT